MFGEVTAGWGVVQAIAQLQTHDFSSVNSALGQVPVHGSSGTLMESILVQSEIQVVSRCCYGNCDGSTTPPVLSANDFQCFLNAFAAGEMYANCDGSTAPPALNANDFVCFLNSFAAGCH